MNASFVIEPMLLLEMKPGYIFSLSLISASEDLPSFYSQCACDVMTTQPNQSSTQVLSFLSMSVVS